MNKYTFVVPIKPGSIRNSALGRECDYDMNIEVSCRSCKGQFAASELQEDSYWEYYSNEPIEMYSTAVCPLCNEWDCCRLSYEQIK